MPAYDAVLFTPPAPLGRVTLRNPTTGAVLPDVPMLLDSGADVTLVPRECVTRLGVQVNPNDAYELAGFDGSASVAQVADLHMAFLGRTFSRAVSTNGRALGHSRAKRSQLSVLSAGRSSPNLA